MLRTREKLELSPSWATSGQESIHRAAFKKFAGLHAILLRAGQRPVSMVLGREAVKAEPDRFPRFQRAFVPGVLNKL
jgi:hypothetical protein